MNTLISDLSPVARSVVEYLKAHGPQTPLDLQRKLNLKHGTRSHVLKRLLQKSICKRFPNLMDMRQPYYYLISEIANRD